MATVAETIDTRRAGHGSENILVAAGRSPGRVVVTGIPVAEIVSALSFALDLTEDAVPGHSVRACLFGMQLAEAIGLPDAQRSDLFYALLLKDVGCSSNAARFCQVIGADDRAFKHDIKLEDWSRYTLSGIRMAWRHLGEGAAGERVVSRLVRLADLGVHQQRNARELITLRCDRGAGIVHQIGLSPATAEAVRHLDEHWDGSGYPGRLRGAKIPLLSRIMLVAQHLDVFGTRRSREAALQSLRERSGRWFDPDLVQVTLSLHRMGRLWHERSATDCRSAVLDLEPGQRLVASEEQIDAICNAFADVVDVKSSFTASHSRGVCAAAVSIAQNLGFAPERLRLISRAALLHDLGKLRVPNTILDKPGRLTPEEWRIVTEHPALTTEILSRVELFADIATVAGQHHEKLDGSGYPYGLRAEDLSTEARLIALADTYGALVEDRPYRAGLEMPEIRKILDKEVVSKLDRQCYDALVAGLDAASDGVLSDGLTT